MSPPIWVRELADRFWSAAGPPPPFPRDLVAPATLALPVRFLPFPKLRLSRVIAWLAENRIPCGIDEPDRPLRACLFTWVGFGFVFLDANDPADERRFSIAHEVAHFLRDYDALRRKVARQLGDGGLEVLDGKRPATIEERMHAVLREVPVAAHVHLMRRDDDGLPESPAEREAESAADRLAFELLAPADSPALTGDLRDCVKCLKHAFGFPHGPATIYASLLTATDMPDDPFVERFKKSL